VYERLAEDARSDSSDTNRADEAAHYIDQAADVYTEAASLALEVDELGAAEQLYTRILLHRPDRAEALLGLARVLAQSGRRLQAIGRYEDYLKTLSGRDDPIAYLEMGELFLEGGYWRRALEALKQGQALAPDEPKIDAALALAYQKGERLDEALEAAEQATQKAPRNAEFRDVLARVELDQGNGEQAAIEARRAIEFTRRALVDQPRATRLLKALDRYYQTYEKALRMLLAEGKANPVVRVDLARAIQERAGVERQRALVQALNVLTDARTGEKGDGRLLEELASVQAALSLNKAAAATCRRLLAAEPTNATARRILKQLEAANESNGG
jgi:tetratricopeptide (TPR) repeat protein